MSVPMKLTSGRMSLDHGEAAHAIRVRNDPMHYCGVPSQSIHLTGGGLSDVFVRHLDAALAGQLAQRTLDDIRSEPDGIRKVEAYDLRRRGQSRKQIAAAMGVSEATITRYIRRVLQLLPEAREPTLDDPYEHRERWLRDHRPLQHYVWEMAGHGWTLAAIVEIMADQNRVYSYGYVKQLHAAAVRFMGESNRRGSRKQGYYRAVTSEDDTDHTREQMLERDPHRYDVPAEAEPIAYSTENVA